MTQRPKPEKRNWVRLAVQGEISATIVSSKQPLVLRDLGAGGFLAEVSMRLRLDSTYQVELRATDGLTVTAQARCAHVRRRLEIRDRECYMVGFAFTAVDSAAVDALIDRLVSSTLSFS